MPQSVQRSRRSFLIVTIVTIPIMVRGTHKACGKGEMRRPANDVSIVDAGAVMVSVDVAEFTPGVTDAGESTQVGIGDGPATVQES